MITTYHISDAPLTEVKTWLRNNAHGKHSENYKNIEFNNNYLAISVERNINKQITCFSSVYKNNFYPDKCVRIFNRWLATRKIGGTKEQILSDRAIQIATQQIYFAEMMGYESFFVSYHSYIPKFCNRLVDLLNQKTEWHWRHAELVKVTPSNKKSSYQHIIYCGNDMEEFINTNIDLKDWRSLC